MTLVRSVVRQIAPLNIFLWQVAAASVFRLATFEAHGRATKSAGEAAVVDMRVELQTVTERVEVSEETQSIATEDITAPSVELTQRQLISLPTAQEKIREVLPATPGVVKTQDGKLNFKGADENQ